MNGLSDHLKADIYLKDKQEFCGVSFDLADSRAATLDRSVMVQSKDTQAKNSMQVDFLNIFTVQPVFSDLKLGLYVDERSKCLLKARFWIQKTPVYMWTKPDEVKQSYKHCYL